VPHLALRIALVLSISLVLANPAPLHSQDASPSRTPLLAGELRGRIVDSASHAPIPRATIDVTLAGSTASVARATAGSDGTFRVTGLPAARYRVRVRTLGFAPRELAAVLGASAGAELGTIALTPVAVEMQRVVVQERQRDVQLAPDRNTYVVHDMPTTRGGNALDVLKNVPSVDVDIDNVVSLRGNSGVIVQINGRKSPMKASQLGNFLAQLPADMVEKVEVIPNPSARDDPEGVAGIINIVLRKEADAGASGGLTIAGGTTGRAEVGGNLGYQHGPLTLFGSYGFLRDSRPRRDSIYRENLFLEPTTYLSERGHRTQTPLAHTLTGSGGYRLSEHDELSADVMYSTRSEEETNTIVYRNLDASRALMGIDDRLSQGRNREFNLESTLGYKHAFAARRHELSAELRLFRGSDGGPEDFTMRSLADDGSPESLLSQESQVGYEHPHETSLRVNYRWPITSTLRLETGYAGTFQQFHTTLDTRVLDTASSAMMPDTSRISDFTYDQAVNAGYGMLSTLVGKFSLQGGVRAEHAATQFHIVRRGAQYDNAYNSLFPSALVAYNIDDARQVKLSFSSRIRRPDDTDLLDPTPHYQDPLNLSRGNPELRPEHIRAFELGFQQSGAHTTVQVTPFYRHTMDAVRTLRTIDSAGVTTRTFANVATSDASGVDATVALHGGRFGGFVGASAFRQVSNASNLDPSLSVRTFGWTARTNASYHVSKTLDLQTLLFYRAPMTVEQGRVGSRTRFSLAARKKLMDDQLNLALRVTDPFNTSRELTTTIDPAFYQVTERQRVERGVLLSVSWTFGKPPKEQRRDERSGDDQGVAEDGG
jgi:outer membrane cobalamin receptor